MFIPKVVNNKEMKSLYAPGENILEEIKSIPNNSLFGSGIA